MCPKRANARMVGRRSTVKAGDTCRANVATSRQSAQAPYLLCAGFDAARPSTSIWRHASCCAASLGLLCTSVVCRARPAASSGCANVASNRAGVMSASTHRPCAMACTSATSAASPWPCSLTNRRTLRPGVVPTSKMPGIAGKASVVKRACALWSGACALGRITDVSVTLPRGQ